MRRASAGIGLAIFVHAVAAGQSSAPAFEVADVHVSPPGTDPFMDGGFLPGGRYQLHNATMVDLITAAWNIDSESVFGGPAWLDSDRFDLIAKAPPSSSKAERARMLRSLLSDRFKLVVHEDQKSLTVYALTVGKRGPQFKEAAGTGDSECKSDFAIGPPALFTLACRNVTLAEFGQRIHQMAGGYLNHQVADVTGLKGTYDFTVKWSPRKAARPPSANGDAGPVKTISVFDAVDKQLGLKLDLTQRPVSVIVVDSVNRTPTENAPGVTTKLPALTTEFEAAEIKPNKSGTQIQRMQPKPGGRIEVENVPLKSLIALAYDFEETRIVGAPKWVDSDRFDIVAKTAILPGEVRPPADTVRLMLRALLVERFKMVVHNEDQPVAVWTLSMGKRGSKLKHADPASRSGCKRGSTQIGTGAAAIPAITYTCQNTTMAQLAEAMHNIAPGYVDHPAVDMTGLKGAYDFTIAWTPRGVIEPGGPGRAPESGQPSAASDPTGGTTFFEAVDKQLGLRLDGGQKHPLPVLVIDHIETLSN